MQPVLMWNCSIRRAKLTDYGCAAVHNTTVESVDKSRTRKNAAPATPADSACAACSGVKWRYENGLENEPTMPPEVVSREWIKTPKFKTNFMRLKAASFEDRTCETCAGQFTPHNSRQRHCRPCIHAPRREPIPCQGCGTVFPPKHKNQRFCSEQCRRTREKSARYDGLCEVCREPIDLDHPMRRRLCSKHHKKASKWGGACVTCGGDRGNRRKYCAQCYKKSVYERSRLNRLPKLPPAPCAVCGTMIEPRNAMHQFCSPKCRNRGRYTN